MREWQGFPHFAAHENYNEDFPAWGGYPEGAFKRVPDASSYNRNSSPTSSTRTIGPRIYHVSNLMRSWDTEKEKSTSTKPRQNEKQTVKSLQGTSVQNGKQSKPPHQFTSLPSHHDSQVAGAFKAQVRVNAPVSLEEKQQQSLENKPQVPESDRQDLIDEILSENEDLRSKVEAFTGASSKEKEYRYLDEMLTRLMLKLDDVNTDKQPSLRQVRKNAVMKVQSSITRLEQKLKENQANQMTSL